MDRPILFYVAPCALRVIYANLFRTAHKSQGLRREKLKMVNQHCKSYLEILNFI